MKSFILPLSLIASAAVGVLAADLKIEVTQEVECDRKTKKGDQVEAHYKGTLASDGSKFDASTSLCPAGNAEPQWQRGGLQRAMSQVTDRNALRRLRPWCPVQLQARQRPGHPRVRFPRLSPPMGRSAG